MKKAIVSAVLAAFVAAVAVPALAGVRPNPGCAKHPLLPHCLR